MSKPVVLLLILFSALYMTGRAQTHVQTATKYQTSTNSAITQAFGASSTSRNLIIVHVDWDNQARKINSVTDSKGNTYKKINGTTNWNGNAYATELWYAYNITGGGGPISVTARLNGAPSSFFQIYISEYSAIAYNIDPLDQNSVAAGSTAAVSSGSKTTSYPNELVYGVSIGASGTLNAGAGFTYRSMANSNIVEDKKATAIGSFNAAFTSAAGNWVAQMATFISTNSILPVELLSFTGHCKDNQIVLEWSTNKEIDNDRFAIERSEDGNNWKVIGTVVRSEISSSSVENYSYTVNEAAKSDTYFRLKQTDLDGQSTYFKVIRVGNCSMDVTGVSIYPNPCNGATLSGRIDLIANERYSIDIFDNFGKRVHHGTITQPGFTVNLAQVLPAGVYYARFSSDVKSMTARILVKH